MTNMCKTTLLIVGLMLLTIIPMFSTDIKSFSSPDGALVCTLTIDNGQLIMSLALNGRDVIEKSPLHMSVDGKEITANVMAGKVRSRLINQTYPVYGLHSYATDHCNSVNITLTNHLSGGDFELEIKVFNDAVAFRFIDPRR